MNKPTRVHGTTDPDKVLAAMYDAIEKTFLFCDMKDTIENRIDIIKGVIALGEGPAIPILEAEMKRLQNSNA